MYSENKMLKNPEDKKKVELLITGIGIIILFFLIANGISRPKTNKAVPKIDFLTSESTVSSFMDNEVQAASRKEWKRDPFLLDTSNIEEHGMEDLDLSGIAADKENPYAVINNDVVKLGDKVNGMTVIEINEKNVVLDENGKTHTLELDVY